MLLRNKAPRWHEHLGAYCLNFGGRVTAASVKNFQLVEDGEPDRTVLQYGKVRRRHKSCLPVHDVLAIDDVVPSR